MLAISYRNLHRMMVESGQEKRIEYLSRSPCICSGEDNVCYILKGGLAHIPYT